MLKTIIFDFDGVIGDTLIFNFEGHKEFFPALSLQEFKDHHNGNIFESRIIKWKPKDLQAFYRKQKHRFTKKHLFPLKKALSNLHKKYQFLIISSNSDSNIRYFLKTGKYDHYFEKIYGADTHQSKITKFKMIFSEQSVKPEECLFITDTIGDIKEARKVSVESIAVTWGFHSKKLLLSEKPLAVVHSPEELLQAVEKLC